MCILKKGPLSKIDLKKKDRILSAISETYENMCTALQHKSPKEVPVVLWSSRAVLGLSKRAQNLKQYFLDPDIKLATQLIPIENFPGLLTLSGINYDLGMVLEPSGFGCNVHWFDNQPPYAEPCLSDLSDVIRLKIPDPHKDGLLPIALNHYKFIMNNMDPALIEACPFYKGSIVVLGQLEIAAAMLGQTNFYMLLYDNPDGLHSLLNHITEGLIKWMTTLEEINSGHQIISIVEHTPGMISASHVAEFFVPYFRKIRDAFPSAIFLYHNEGPGNHYMRQIPEIGTNIFFCGDVDLRKAKLLIGNDVTLMGNLDPLKLIRDGTKDEVFKESLKRLSAASKNGGFFLSCGGLAGPPGSTPWENISAMMQAAKTWCKAQ